MNPSQSLGALPSVYEELNFRSYYLKWMEFTDSKKQKYSIRDVAKICGMSFGHLSEILSNKRRISKKVFVKLTSILQLPSSEVNFLWNLVVLTDAKTHSERQMAYEHLCRFHGYKYKHKLSVEAHRYASNWYYLAIREMAGLKDFKADAKWIQSRLKQKVSIKDIELCLNFLIEKKYLDRNSAGDIQLTNDLIQCDEGVLRFAMAHAHRQFLELAQDSIYNTERDDRLLNGYTLSIAKDDLGEVKEVLSKALDSIKSISKRAAVRNDRDEVYNISLLAFPLTKKMAKLSD